MNLITRLFGISLVLISYLGQDAFALSGVVFEDQPLDFEMYFSDIFCWLPTGKCSGKVASNAYRKNAQALQSKLQEATTLNMAIYGVRNQPWFMDLVSDLLKVGKNTVKVLVDQEQGERGDFEAGNFVYSDTGELLSLLDPDSFQVDLNRDGSTRKGTIMHNKFIVADNRSVYMGSTNISDTCLGAEYNANHSIWINSEKLSEVFNREFNQMFVKKRFSREKQPSPKPHAVQYSDGSLVEAYFSPQDSILSERVVGLIDDARVSIDVAMYYLTSRPIAESLIAARKRGVNVRIIIDASSARHPYSHTAAFLEAGVDLKVENWGGKMHMKTAVFDSSILVMGSMNWTGAGESDNDESTLIIAKNQRAIKETSNYFNRLWSSLDAVEMGLNPVLWPRAESKGSFNSCEDGVDNDHDQSIDRCRN